MEQGGSQHIGSHISMSVNGGRGLGEGLCGEPGERGMMGGLSVII